MGLFETIQYQVIKKNNQIEIRQYDDYFLASTMTAVNSSLDSGFNNVFLYISGENKDHQKISMTTPVVTYEENQKLVTGFYVPSKYSKQNIPAPKDDTVFINEVKKSFYVVIRFKGSWKPQVFEKYHQILLKYINDNHLVIKSPKMIMRYQPPFIPSFLRRNEIAYQIEYTVK